MVNWLSTVNDRAYEVSPDLSSNYTEVKFESGKIRRYQNGNAYKKYSFKLRMQDSPTETDTEYKRFMNWYKNTDYSGALSFGFPNLDGLGTTAEYYFNSTPTASGQKIKIVSLEVIEA